VLGAKCKPSGGPRQRDDADKFSSYDERARSCLLAGMPTVGTTVALLAHYSGAHPPVHEAFEDAGHHVLHMIPPYDLYSGFSLLGRSRAHEGAALVVQELDLFDKLTAAIRTRYGTQLDLRDVKNASLAIDIAEWAGVRVSDGGDSIQSSARARVPRRTGGTRLTFA
jgi:hypothetical protein